MEITVSLQRPPQKVYPTDVARGSDLLWTFAMSKAWTHAFWKEKKKSSVVLCCLLLLSLSLSSQPPLRQICKLKEKKWGRGRKSCVCNKDGGADGWLMKIKIKIKTQTTTNQIQNQTHSHHKSEATATNQNIFKSHTILYSLLFSISFNIYVFFFFFGFLSNPKWEGKGELWRTNR